MHKIDDSLSQTDTTQKSITSKPKIQEFLKTYCLSRHYMFCIKKCRSPCEWCILPRLPPEVFSGLYLLPDLTPKWGKYEEFHTLYGSQTNESYRPWLAEAECKSDGVPCPPSAQHARSTGLVIQCDKCRKWWLLYSRKKIVKAQRDELQEIVEMLSYSCGCRLQDIQDTSTEVNQEVFVKATLSCTSPIEVPYCSPNYKDICRAESDLCAERLH